MRPPHFPIMGSQARRPGWYVSEPKQTQKSPTHSSPVSCTSPSPTVASVRFHQSHTSLQRPPNQPSHIPRPSFRTLTAIMPPSLSPPQGFSHRGPPPSLYPMAASPPTVRRLPCHTLPDFQCSKRRLEVLRPRPSSPYTHFHDPHRSRPRKESKIRC